MVMVQFRLRVAILGYLSLQIEGALMSSQGNADKGGRLAAALGAHTQVTVVGRNAAANHGFVNTPICRGSTVLFPTMEAFRTYNQEYTYGRLGTPTTRALEQAIADLEEGHKTWLTPSGLSAVTTALLGFAEAGAHFLVADSVYQPTRRFCGGALRRFGVEVEYYDPLIGEGVGALIRSNTRVIFAESPGSLTFEMQDIPALARAARPRGVFVVIDNTWATPLYFKPFSHGADVSIQAATKYIIGHADAMLGAITANEKAAPIIDAAHREIGQCAAPDDCYLALRGLRTLAVRLDRHWQAGVEMAQWLQARPEVAQVIHPALPDDKGHALWKRDFLGASGLFSIILHPVHDQALAAMLDGLERFGMGYSWGGFESLATPFVPTRTATSWKPEGPALRLHIGLEDLQDLKVDLEQGFARLRAFR
jgi:cysteine-S-conjugate beta-lyase